MNEALPTSFFAVQLHAKESPESVARLILRTAHDARLLFSTLEVLDIIEVGGSSFLRVKIDLPSQVIVDKLLIWGRSVISTSQGVYIMRRPAGEQGKIPMTVMHNVTRPGQQRSDRGTRQWEAQLAS